MTDADDYNDTYDYGWGVAGHYMWNYNDTCGVGIFGGWFETDQDTDSTPTSERYVIGIEGLNQLGGLDIHWQGGGLLGDG